MNKISKYVKLNNDLLMPTFGLGTSNQKEQLPELIYQSIKNGLRLIDTAAVYENEIEVGLGINNAIKDGIVNREELFVITKLCVTDKHDPENSLRNSLEKLNLDYVDLYLDHWGLFINKDRNGEIQKTPLHILWKNMENLVKKGLTKSIGVSNYGVSLLTNLLSFCEIKPVALEIEYHPYNYNYKLVEYCFKNDIHVIAYGSLVKANYVSMFHSDKNYDLLSEEIVQQMAEKYNKTKGQILLNWALSQGLVIIPMTGKLERMNENMEALDFTMTKEDIFEIAKLNKNYRFCGSSVWGFSEGVDIFA